MRSDLLAMTTEELRRLRAIHRLAAGTTTQARIAAELGLSARQVKRLWRAFRRDGERGLVSGHRGHASNRRRDPAQLKRAIDIVREHYADFGPTLASEKLRERHALDINRESLRAAMIAAGLWKPHPRRRTLHPPRERRACFGELVQIDGSPHAWFEQRGPRCTLLVFIDDATSRLGALHFTPAETTAGYFLAARQYFERHGLPQAFYSDRLNVFRINLETVNGDMTQFGQAMDRLGVELICANSPQAKGRVERANRTLQDRLVKELRLANISDIDAANTFAVTYIEEHNARFAVAARKSEDAHRPIVSDDLNRILVGRRTRKLTKEMLFQDRNIVYRVTTTQRRLVFPHALIEVLESPNGEMLVERNGASLTFELVHRRDTARIHSAKTLNEHLDGRRTQAKDQPKKAHAPDRKHPWRLEKEADVHRALARSRGHF